MADAASTALVDSSGIGCQRAAAVLLGIGPDVATAVFKALGEPELRRIALGAKELRTRGSQVMNEALEQFVSTMESVAGDAAGGDDLLREVAERALGADAARRAFDGVQPPPPPDEVLGPVSQADPESLAMVLQREQPQTIALPSVSLAGKVAPESDAVSTSRSIALHARNEPSTVPVAP